jgi:ankyrin repeat protein
MRPLAKLLILLTLLSICGCSKSNQPSARSTKPSDDQIKAILTALSTGDIATMKSQFGETLDPNFTFADGKTTISASSSVGNAEATRYLLSIGADPAKGDKRGMTPLHYAALYGRDSVIPILTGAGVSVNVREASGLTPLHCAATGDSESTVRLLFEKGADPKLKDGFGATPERTAILNKKEKLATLIQQLTK